MPIVTPSEDIIDSRDVIERIAELEAMPFEGLRREDDPEIGEEYAALRDLREQGETLGDWAYGVALISDDYFVEYAKQLAEDIGAIDREAAWPACHIDWAAAADSLQMDYTDIEFCGVTYWAR